MFFGGIQFKEGERVVLEVRRFWLTLALPFLVGMIFLGTPFFFLFWLFAHHWWGISFFYLSIGIGLYIIVRSLFKWWRNCCIITTHRIIDREQRGFFDQVLSEVSYDSIEDVYGRIRGFWGTLFRLGSISVQTGNGKVQIVMNTIRHPQKVQNVLQELRRGFNSRSVSRDDIGGIIKIIAHLSKQDLRRIDEAVQAKKKFVD